MTIDYRKKTPGTERVFTSGPGILSARIRMAVGQIRVITEQDRTTPEITVSTDNSEGPSADAVRGAVFTQNDDHLDLVIPETRNSLTYTNFSGTDVYQYVSSIGPGQSVTGLVISSDGTRHANVTTNISPITVTLHLPTAFVISLQGNDTDMEITGALTGVTGTVTSGKLTADTLGMIEWTSTSGDINIGNIMDADTGSKISTHAGAVTIGQHHSTGSRIGSTSRTVYISRNTGRDLKVSTAAGHVIITENTGDDTQISTVNGTTNVDSHTGRGLRVNSVSGGIWVHARAGVRIKATTVSGPIGVTATQEARDNGLTVDTRTVNGRVNIPQQY